MARPLITVGEVYNGTSTSQGPSMITVKLYNAAGHLLATRTGRTDMYVPHGARAPFRIVGSVPAGYAKAVVTASPVATHSTLVSVPYTGVTQSYDSNRFHLQGSVRSSVAVTSLRVLMTTYNRVGTVLDVTRATVASTTLAANVTMAFDALSSYVGTIDKVALKSVGIK